MKIVSILNCKGGCGKTAAAINLAYEFSKKYKVLLIDLDPQADASSKFTNNYEEVNGISEVLKQEVSIKEVIQKAETNTHLYFVPSKFELNETNDLLGAKAQVAVLKKAIDSVRDVFDVVIIDNNPNCMALFRNNIYAADIVLIPITIYNNAIKGIDYTIRQITKTIEDSPLPLNVDYRVYFSITTYNRNVLSINARRVFEHIVKYYNTKVLKTCIKEQWKAAQDQSFYKSYFPVDDPSSAMGNDFVRLASELENTVLNLGR